VEGKISPLGDPQTFTAHPLNFATLPAPDQAAVLAFQQKTGRLQRAVLGANEAVKEARSRIQYLKKAVQDTPGVASFYSDEVRSLEKRLRIIQRALTGDRTLRTRNEPTPPSILARVQRVVSGHWSTTSAPTQTHRKSYEVAGRAFEPVLADLQTLVEKDLKTLEEALEAQGASWTPGRVPRWSRE
jgi:hypothetical protein